jgi:hypothetical protein
MKTIIIGQIHDSLVADVVPEEQDEFIAMVRTIVEIELPKHWPWLIVPMAVEAEGTPTDGSWATKKKIEDAPRPPSKEDDEVGWKHRAAAADRRERENRG